MNDTSGNDATAGERPAAGQRGGTTMWEDDGSAWRPGPGWRLGYGWPQGPGGRGRQGGVPPSQMRVSDAERNEVAEALSKHFADGRLDQAELDERMTRAMSAKTRGDLAGLLDDLPPLPGPLPGTDGVPVAAPPPLPARRGRGSTVLFAVLLVLLLQASVGVFFWHPAAIWIWLVVIAVLLHHRSRRRRFACGPCWHGTGERRES
jgi:hypothetical protein